MKHLILLRHAQAVSDHAGGDIARPLSSRGVQQIQQVANTFRARKYEPELALVSPAVRTQQTATLLGKQIGKLDVVTDRALYLATDDQILDVLRGVPDDIQSLLIVGHNPGISDLAAIWDPVYRKQSLPTAGFIACHIPISSWHDIRQSC